MKDYIILLPPSEGKNEGGDKEIYETAKNYNKFKNLSKETSKIREKILLEIKNSKNKTEKIFEAKDKNLDKAIFNLENLNKQKTLEAIERYTGVMFKEIDYQNLKPEIKKNFNSKIIFIDALFGLLKPKDLIPNYKFPISSSLKPALFWKNIISNEIQKIAENKIIIDLLPKAHRQTLNENLNTDKIKIIFSSIKNGKISEEGHNSKKLKGELIKYLLLKDKIDENYIKEFKHSQGHIFSKNLSKISKNNQEIIFLKK